MNQPVQQSSDLPVSVIEFDAFLNEPPIYESERMVRDYRHEAYAKWAKVVDDIRKLAATQVVADQSIEQILNALKAAQQFIANGIGLGFIRMPDADVPDPAHKTLPLIESAISLLASNAGKASSEPAVAAIEAKKQPDGAILSSAPDAPLAIDGWLTIDSAPKDGEYVRLLSSQGEDVGRWQDERYCILGAPQGSFGPGFVDKENHLPMYAEFEPHYWQPLQLPRSYE